jgi:hypothetical protein
MELQRQVSTSSSNGDDADEQMELTLNNITKLQGVFEAYEFADYNDIPIENIETLEELKERFIMHLKKSKGRNRKLKVKLYQKYR